MNTSDCRFQNTAIDLRDCLDNLFDYDLSDDESRARRRLIQICREIVAAVDNDDPQEVKLC